MLPSLPGPGTLPFAKLVKGLAAFGIEPSGVTLDAPTSKLSDVALAIVLDEKRVIVRITAAAFNLYVTSLIVGDDEALVQIGELILNAVKEIDADADKADITIRTSSHLKLLSADVDDLLREHLALSNSMTGFTPDAAAYKAGSGPGINSSDLRIVIAKSVGYVNSVFVDLNRNYSSAPIADLAGWANADFEVIMERLGLKEAEPS
jgi:hypothetical protein